MRKAKLPVLLVIPAALCAGAAVALAQGSAPAPVKIGVVNQDRVMNESTEGKRLRDDIDKLRGAKQAALEAKEKELKLLQDQAQGAQLSMSDEKREEIARQFKRKRVEYERLNDDATAEVQEAINRAQGRLLALFRESIAKYAAEKGYTVIFEKSTVHFANEAADVTDEVLARFNASTQAAAPAPPKG